MENECVGAPCGIMDQMAVTLGAESELLALVCQPADLQSPVAIPANVRFWGLDSGELYTVTAQPCVAGRLPSNSDAIHAAGERHSVGGADYGTVRAAAFMGLRMISTAAKGATSRGGGSHAGFAAQDGSIPEDLIGAQQCADALQCEGARGADDALGLARAWVWTPGECGPQPILQGLRSCSS